jgi:hypothetical protein
LGDQLSLVTPVELRWEDVPGVQYLAVRSADGEGGDLVVQEAEGLGDVEIFLPGQGHVMEVEDVRLEERNGQQVEKARINGRGRGKGDTREPEKRSKSNGSIGRSFRG